MQYLPKHYTALLVITAILLPGFVFANTLSNPQNREVLNAYSQGDLNGFVCTSLQSIGIGCRNGSASQNSLSNSTTVRNNSTGIFSFNFFGQRTRLVKVQGDSLIYSIRNGKKHLIPTEEIFRDYGYRFEDVEEITGEELNSYPRVKLVYKKGDSKKIHYLTETSMLRLIPDKKILESYGTSSSEAIQISEKEFGSYQINVYVYQENPYNSDIFLLNPQEKRKQYVTPMAAARLGIQSWQVAPVSKAEMDWYKTYKPIVN